MSPRTAPTRTASLSPIDGLLLVRAGASLQPHTRQCRPATPRQNAKKGLQHAYRRRGLSPAAPLAQIARSALVWVEAEGVGQLGGRVAHEVEHDSFVHLCPYNSPHPARVMHPQMDGAQNKAARSDARTSPSVPPGTEGGPSRPRRTSRSAPQHREAEQQGQESAAARATAAAAAALQKLVEYGGSCWCCHTNPRTIRTPAPPPGARLLNPNPNPSPDPTQVVRRHPALVFLHSGASDFRERYAETCPLPFLPSPWQMFYSLYNLNHLRR